MIVKLEAVRDPDLSLEQIKRMMRTIFINHSERLSVTKKNPESNRYQGSNRRGRETGRESAMSTAFITCHYCKKAGHKVRECKKLKHIMEYWHHPLYSRRCSSYYQYKHIYLKDFVVAPVWSSTNNADFMAIWNYFWLEW